jgi:Ca2+-binding EF-hand superfamily protein
MCLFEKMEMMKFCFFVFDKDKNGYVERDELDVMLNVFHHIGPGEKLKGNMSIAKKALKVSNDGKIEFDDCQEFAKVRKEGGKEGGKEGRKEGRKGGMREGG